MENELKRAAQAVLLAQDRREASWNGIEYDLSCWKAYQDAYKEANLSNPLIELLSLADASWNDIQDWAKRILG